MSKQSAGLLVYKIDSNELKVLILHPGGPLYARRDDGIWLLPKGEVEDGEDKLEAAYREFKEEVGVGPPAGEPIDLGSAKASSKTNYIWALEGDVDLQQFKCNTFIMEWPPRSGKMQEFPECDRAEWFDSATAKRKLYKSQAIFIDRLTEHLGAPIDESPQQPSLF